jgi:hypothetical protein
VHGAYAEDELAELIAEIKPHVVWFPGSCPETYSYTLSAVLEAGLPVVATDIGAFTERLAGREWTWLVPPDRSTSDIITHFLAIQRMLSQASGPDVPAVGEVSFAEFSYTADYAASIEQLSYSLDEQFDPHGAWRLLPASQTDIAFSDVRSPLARKILPAILHNQWLGPLIARLPHNLKQSIKERLRS